MINLKRVTIKGDVADTEGTIVKRKILPNSLYVGNLVEIKKAVAGWRQKN